MNMRELVIATKNAGKVPEIAQMLGAVPFKIVGLAEQGITFDVEEPCLTYEGNAVVKAVTYGKASGKLTLAEDSGIEVDALGGKPGIFTARFSATNKTKPYAALLEAMKEVPEGKRAAQFHSVIAIYDPANDKIRTCEGINVGRVALEPKGEGGFGHDPIFYYDNGEKTGAEMLLEEKNKISHRGRALAKARQTLLAEFA